MYIFAYALLLSALCASLCAAGECLVSLWRGRGATKFALRAHWAVSGCLLLAGALLLHALFWRDFSLEYVVDYTDSALPVFYRLTAFWAGQPGSMLFWAICSALSGSIFALGRPHAGLDCRTRLFFWLFFYALSAFFCMILTGFSNPFVLIEPAPSDGHGLNPLLQNPGMIFHPPLLFMGYAGFSVPACLALAAGAAGSGRKWFALSRPFMIAAWCLLGAGIILGAWWAYMELGWGGYWAWDPVENASLLPWLLATALMHVLAAGGGGAKLSRTSAALAALVLTSAFFATWLVRGGAVQSVHAFGGGGVGLPLLVFVLASAPIGIFAASLGPRGAPLAGPASREGLLVMAAWIFVILAAIIGVATLWPVLSILWSADAVGVGQGFYNTACLPLAAALMVLLLFCRFCRRGGGVPSAAAGIAAAAAMAVMYFTGYRQLVPLVSATAAAGVVAGSLADVLAGRLRGGAFGAHLGMAVLVIGVAFSGPYSREGDFSLARGGRADLDGYELVLRALREGRGSGYDYLRAELEVYRNGERLGALSPERRLYDKFGQMQFAEASVLPGPGDELYATLLGLDGQGRASVRLSIEPLVNWIWAGGAILTLLPLAGVLLRRSPRGKA